MGAQGTDVLNFGAFPGSNVAVTDVVATGVVSTSAVEAWIRAVANADHSATDHVAAPMKVTGRYLSDNNIRITGVNLNDVIPPLEPALITNSATQVHVNLQRKPSPMFVGQFNVFWCWN